MLSTPVKIGGYKDPVAYQFEALNAPISVQTALDGTSTILSIKEAVIAEFGPTSPMVDVARCESGFRQFNSKGEVLRGIENGDDKGIFQINSYYHLEASKRLGYDIGSVFGNIGYARYLYDHQGLAPWGWSKPCWSGG